MGSTALSLARPAAFLLLMISARSATSRSALPNRTRFARLCSPSNDRTKHPAQFVGDVKTCFQFLGDTVQLLQIRGSTAEHEVKIQRSHGRAVNRGPGIAN